MVTRWISCALLLSTTTPGRFAASRKGVTTSILRAPPFEADHLDVVVLGELGDRLAVGVSHGAEQRRGGDRVAPVVVKEVDDAPRGLQLGLVDVQVEAVEALQIEGDVAVK